MKKHEEKHLTDALFFSEAVPNEENIYYINARWEDEEGNVHTVPTGVCYLEGLANRICGFLNNNL